MRVAVAGGTGVVGKHVVDSLEQAGHEPVVLARSRGVNVATGEGLIEALDGVEVGGRLQQRRRRCGRARQSSSSVPSRATCSPREGLQALNISSPCPSSGSTGSTSGTTAASACRRSCCWRTIARRACCGPRNSSSSPGNCSTGCAARSCSCRRCACNPSPPARSGRPLPRSPSVSPIGRAPDMAGPREESLVDLVRQVVRRRGKRRLVVGMRMPGSVGKQMAGGGLLPEGDGRRGKETFEQYLKELGPAG